VHRVRWADRASRSCNLRVEEGQVVGLLGGSGSGKTTVLREILGLLRPTMPGASSLFGVRPRRMARYALVQRNRCVVASACCSSMAHLFSALSAFSTTLLFPCANCAAWTKTGSAVWCTSSWPWLGLKPSHAKLKPAELSGGYGQTCCARSCPRAGARTACFLTSRRAGLDPDRSQNFVELIGQWLAARTGIDSRSWSPTT
jgi:phospholipid/cholesterol/gamma-HCH transport system ATP-binding protein